MRWRCFRGSRPEASKIDSGRAGRGNRRVGDGALGERRDSDTHVPERRVGEVLGFVCRGGIDVHRERLSFLVL